MIAQGQVRLLTTRRALTPLMTIQGQVRHLTTHRVLTPLMVIEGQVQYLVAIACLVPTRKLAGQFLPLALRLMGMGGPGSHSQPSSHSKSWSSRSQSYTSSTPSHSFLSLPPRFYLIRLHRYDISSQVSSTDSTPEEGFFSIQVPLLPLPRVLFLSCLCPRLTTHYSCIGRPAFFAWTWTYSRALPALAKNPEDCTCRSRSG
jgi:hypothetical protein